MVIKERPTYNALDVARAAFVSKWQLCLTLFEYNKYLLSHSFCFFLNFVSQQSGFSVSVISCCNIMAIKLFHTSLERICANTIKMCLPNQNKCGISMWKLCLCDYNVSAIQDYCRKQLMRT